jgi:hypothetical protein
MQLAAAVLLALLPQTPAVEGVYERVSITNVTTGELAEAANRKGLLIIAQGHYSMMTMNPERRQLESGQKVEDLPEDTRVAFLKEWLDINAHSGRYEIDDDTLVWHRDISEDPKEVGTTSRLKFEMRDDGATLVIHFALRNGNRFEWVWKRLR